MQKRLNKEINFDKNDNFTIKYGTTNRTNPKVLYFVCNSWIKPANIENIKKNIENAMTAFKEKLSNDIKNHEFLDKKLIFDYDLSFFTAKEGKFNNFSCNFYISQNKFKTIKDVKPFAENFIAENVVYLDKLLKENEFSTSKVKI